MNPAPGCTIIMASGAEYSVPEDLATVLKGMADTDATGMFVVTNEGGKPVYLRAAWVEAAYERAL